MGMSSMTKSGVGISHSAEHRDGHCSVCDGLLDAGVIDKMPLRWCSRCQDWKEGKLIAKEITLTPPKPPTCTRIPCIWRYFKDVIVYSLISMYEARRFSYAQANRNKNILERYRTGDPRPETLWQAIHANIKLTCPICRKYNSDPLLFRR